MSLRVSRRNRFQLSNMPEKNNVDLVNRISASIHTKERWAEADHLRGRQFQDSVRIRVNGI